MTKEERYAGVMPQVRGVCEGEEVVGCAGYRQPRAGDLRRGGRPMAGTGGRLPGHAVGER